MVRAALKEEAHPLISWGASFLLVTTLIAPIASAAGVPFVGQFTATSAQALGPHDLGATLVAFLQKNQFTDGKASPDFTLDAKNLHVKTYYSDPSFHMNNNPISAIRMVSHENYTIATVQGLINRQDYRWYLFSLNPGDAKVEIISSCSKIVASSDSHTVRQSKVPYDAPDNTITVTTANSLSWTDCSSEGASIKVTGKFLLMLWEWDATLHADGRDHPLPSGQGRSSTDPIGSPETQSAVSYDRQRYLYVEDGTLTIPHLSGSNYVLYAGPNARLDAQGSFAVEGATGQLNVQGRNVDLHGGAMKATGQSTAVLSGTDAGKPFAAELAGSPETVSVDGQAVAWQPISPSRAMQAWWMAGVALAGLAGGAILALMKLRRSPRRRAHAIVQRAVALPRIHAEQVEKECTQAIQMDARQGVAYFLRARARCYLGDSEAALKDCHAAWNQVPEDWRSAVAWQAVVAAHLVQLPQQRSLWLQRAHQASHAELAASMPGAQVDSSRFLPRAS